MGTTQVETRDRLGVAAVALMEVLAMETLGKAVLAPASQVPTLEAKVSDMEVEPKASHQLTLVRLHINTGTYQNNGNEFNYAFHSF